MSDGGPARNRFAVAMRARRGRAVLGVKVSKSFKNMDTRRSVVRSIAWLDVWRGMLWNISNVSPILLSNVFVDLDGSRAVQTISSASLATGNPILLPCGVFEVIGVSAASNNASKYLVAITQGSAGAVECHASDPC